MENYFTTVYKTKAWGEDGLGSGGGSTIHYNIYEYIPFMRAFIEERDVRTVVDVGCGAWASTWLIYQGLDVEYMGYDVVKSVVESNVEKFPQHTFKHSDCIAHPDVLPRADLCVLKDVLQHMSTRNIVDFLDGVINRGLFKYILITNCCNQTEDYSLDEPVEYYGWSRPLSCERFPLNRYNIQRLMTYNTKETSIISGYKIEFSNKKS